MIIESLCADDTFAFGKKLGEAAESVMKSLRENVFIKPMFFKLKIVNVL